ncbi:hypothetical protein KDH_78370 [Dictyobacter sp. S3.2.2.5]|uniref:DUF2071 domain-containing protein n=1 Tax=Dictyobacter halimunensis TaxID=3026934 RepID=A0ABQ6G857_9CHLR|nr:hypothetical protein KDH_78370 [Dictyobacter sp. S3.2.2.5]
MQIPTLQGIIDRRLLINYRVDPAYLQKLLPAPFRPKRLHGMGIAGICLIRLKQLRPRGLPAQVGLASENAAHRIAVEWEEDGNYREGVYIPRRDTASQVVTLIGGRLFPGLHYHATFQVKEDDENFSVRMLSDDGETRVAVQAQSASRLPDNSIFASLEEASAFFEHGLHGYSVTNKPGTLDNLALHCKYWEVEPLQVIEAQSSFFDDPTRFPEGTAELDCALLMRAIPHEWHVGKPFSTEKESPIQNTSALI